MGRCDFCNTTLRASIFSAHWAPLETLCCFTLYVISDVEGQHGPDGDVVLKHLLRALLDCDETFQLARFIDVCDVADIRGYKGGIVHATHLLNLVEYLNQSRPDLLTCSHRLRVPLWCPQLFKTDAY